MYDTLTFFFANACGTLDQTDYLCLEKNMGIDEFRSSLVKKINALNTGDGILIYCDVLGGSPCNTAMEFLRDDVQMITGMNLGMLMETMANRTSELSDYVTSGKNGIMNAAEALNDEQEGSFF